MEYALESGQFVMYLQPKYNIKLDKFCGSEALVRWQYTEKRSYIQVILFLYLKKWIY